MNERVFDNQYHLENTLAGGSFIVEFNLQRQRQEHRVENDHVPQEAEPMIAHRLVPGQDLQQNGKPKRHQDGLGNLRRRIWEHENEDTCQHDTSGALDDLVEEPRWLVRVPQT